MEQRKWWGGKGRENDTGLAILMPKSEYERFKILNGTNQQTNQQVR